MDDKFDDDTFCYHPSFIGTTNDKSNDPDSLQEEALVFKRIPVHSSNYLEEFSPLERQYCTPLSIPKLPVVRSELCKSLALDKWKKHFSKNAFSINREVRVAKSSSQISAGEIDVNVISEATSKKIKSSNPEHVVYHEPDHCTDQSVSNSNIGKTFHNQLSTNQYNPRQQFLGQDRKFLSLVQLSDVYLDDDLQNEGVSIDHFRDDIVHLHHRLHCISSDLELDLFNKSVILSGKSFTSTHDDIELQVYSDLPTTYLMCCSDISKAPRLAFECHNIARKSFEYEKDDAYCKYITNVMQCKENNLSFLGFVTMHLTGKDQNVLSSFTIQSFVLYSDMQSFTRVSVGHTCSSLCETTIMLRLLQIVQLLRYIDKSGAADVSLSLLINAPTKYMTQTCIEAYENIGFTQRNVSSTTSPDFLHLFIKDLICLPRYTLRQGLVKYILPQVPLYEQDTFTQKNLQNLVVSSFLHSVAFLRVLLDFQLYPRLVEQ